MTSDLRMPSKVRGEEIFGTGRNWCPGLHKKESPRVGDLNQKGYKMSRKGETHSNISPSPKSGLRNQRKPSGRNCLNFYCNSVDLQKAEGEHLIWEVRSGSTASSDQYTQVQGSEDYHPPNCPTGHTRTLLLDFASTRKQLRTYQWLLQGSQCKYLVLE